MPLCIYELKHIVTPICEGAAPSSLFYIIFLKAYRLSTKIKGELIKDQKLDEIWQELRAYEWLVGEKREGELVFLAFEN